MRNSLVLGVILTVIFVCVKVTQPMNPCCSFPCQNQGICLIGKEPGTYTCDCSREFYGQNCETPYFWTRIVQWIRPTPETVHSWLVSEKLAWLWNLINNIKFIHDILMRRIYLARANILDTPPIYETIHDYPTVAVTTNHTLYIRTLPPVPRDCPTPMGVKGKKELPDIDLLVKTFFVREKFRPEPMGSSLLLTYFAQHFTHMFFKTDHNKPEQTWSGHGVDMTSIYGYNVEEEHHLRSMKGGKLKMQILNGEDFPLYHSDIPGIKMRYPEQVPKESRFALGHPFYGLLPGLFLYQTIWMREHNRICDVLLEEHPDWDDERIFQTAKLITVGETIKIVIEDYVQHLAGYLLKVAFKPEVLFGYPFQYSNKIAIEFNHLYHWHPLMPDTFNVSGKMYNMDEYLFRSDLVVKHGTWAMTDSLSRQRAGHLSHHNHGPITLKVLKDNIRHGRQLRFQSFNNYRARFRLQPYKTFQELTGETDMAAELERLYGDIDAVEVYVGMLMEKRRKNALMGSTIVDMGGPYSVKGLMANPICSPQYWKPSTFGGERGFEIVKSASLKKLFCDNIRGDCPLVLFRVPEFVPGDVDELNNFVFRPNQEEELLKSEGMNPCCSFPCQNRGICLTGKEPGTYTCDCSSKFYGKNCETPYFWTRIAQWIRPTPETLHGWLVSEKLAWLWNLINNIKFIHDILMRRVYLVRANILDTPPIYETVHDYPTVAVTTNHTLYIRTLPPVPRDCPTPMGIKGKKELPDIDLLAKTFFVREKFRPEPMGSSLLLTYFAQHFTHMFFKTDHNKPEQTWSGHGVDMTSLYGYNVEVEHQLRSMKGGKLKMQILNGEDFPLYHSDIPGIQMRYPEQVPKESRFALGHPFYGLLPGLFLYQTIWMREHNRICDVLLEEHPDWDDERIFQTAKLITVGETIKIVIEDYVQHLAGYLAKVAFKPEVLFGYQFQYSNKIAIEFQHLYHWHPLMPDTFNVSGKMYNMDEYLFRSDLVVKHGTWAMTDSLSRQRAGHLSHHNHGPITLKVLKDNIRHGRQLRFQSFNNYRARFNLQPYKTFEELTGETDMAAELERLYGDIDAVEVYVGMLMEKRRTNALMGSTIVDMGGPYSVKGLLANPICSPQYWKPSTFGGERGFEIVKSASLKKLFCDNIRGDCPLVLFRVPEFVPGDVDELNNFVFRPNQEEELFKSKGSKSEKQYKHTNPFKSNGNNKNKKTEL